MRNARVRYPLMMTADYILRQGSGSYRVKLRGDLNLDGPGCGMSSDVSWSDGTGHNRGASSKNTSFAIAGEARLRDRVEYGILKTGQALPKLHAVSCGFQISRAVWYPSSP